MNRSVSFGLALATALLTACGGAAVGGAGLPAATGNRPADNTHTRAASTAVGQAALNPAEAEGYYRTALDHALQSIETDPENARGYFVAGQAHLGLHDWVGADTMFVRAVDLFPAYEEEVLIEREEGWVNAYNMGIEAVNEGDLESGLALFEAADLLYQERPEARMNIGWTNMQLGNTLAAAEGYLAALEILEGEPPEALAEEQGAQWQADRRVAAINAAQLLAQSGEFARAARVVEDFLERHGGTVEQGLHLQLLTAQAGFLAQAGETERAEALYSQILTREGLSANDYFQIGIGLFNTEDYERAAEAFQTSAEMNPYSRDALFNLVQALFSQAEDLSAEPQSAARDTRLRELYTTMASTAHQVREFDPMNRNLLSFMLRAYRGLANLSSGAQADQYAQESQEIYRTYQAQPFEVLDISLSLQNDDVVEVAGVLRNTNATPGSPVQIRFSILGSSGETVQSETVRLQAPPQGQEVEFTTRIGVPDDFAGWRYELVQ